MAPVALPYLNVFRVRGLAVAHYRRDGVRIRLRHKDGRPIDPERDPAALAQAWQRAHDAHEAANAQAAQAAKDRQVRPRSIADLIQRYRASPEWAEKKTETKRDYEKALAPLERDWGHLPAAGMQRHHVTGVRDRYAWRVAKVDGKEVRTPNTRQANRVVTVLSILLSYAVDPLGWRPDNPALRPKRLRAKGDDYRAWTKAEFAQFWERSGPDWRFAALLALLTAQRGQDQVAMTWSDYNGTEIHVAQEKGGKRVKLWLWCPPALKAELDARHEAAKVQKVVPLTILLRPDGSGWDVNAFRKAAGQAIRAAGLKGPVWHGLRATAATWAADGQATEKALQAMLGHMTPNMSQHYARAADQRRLARSAIEAIRLPIGNASGTPSDNSQGRRVTTKGRNKA